MTKSCIFVPIATDRFMFKLTYQKEQNKTFKKKDLRIFYIYVIIIKKADSIVKLRLKEKKTKARSKLFFKHNLTIDEETLRFIRIDQTPNGC